MIEDNSFMLKYSPKDGHFASLRRATASCEEVPDNLRTRLHETGLNHPGQVSGLVVNGSLETYEIVGTTTAVTVVHGGDKGARSFPLQ